MTPLRIALTLGDPGGIGPELVVRAASNHRPDITPVIYGTEASLEAGCLRAGVSVAKVAGFLRPCNGPSDVPVGEASRAAGECALSAIHEATSAALRGEIAALVTAPISKESIALAGESSAGHTGLLARICQAHRVDMVFAAEALRVFLLTTHIPFREIAGKITKQSIYDGLKNFDRALRLEFDEPDVQIRVASLNPHRGENGLLGSEEIEAIGPGVEEARSCGINAVGPVGNEGLFKRCPRGNPQGILALYHDQALAPLKGIDGLDMVNITTGLPIIRTSPDHGTAYDIVGTGRASIGSLNQAIDWAARLVRSRRKIQQRSGSDETQ